MLLKFKRIFGKDMLQNVKYELKVPYGLKAEIKNHRAIESST